MDETTFQNVYERLAPQLRSYLRVLCRDTALADDLVQEAFLRFLRTGVSGLSEFQMKAYLYKSATSALTDYWRARQRERRWELPAPEGEFVSNPDLTHDMKRLFKNLTTRQQALLWLAYVEGFQHAEIAQLLGIKEDSVKVVLLRARRELAAMLTAEGLAPGGRS
ncbi:MAG TPA: RNA polymerase sigma factor [Terriglobia bacterium]|nr:RNA polymerase sigma factor [Terriglobia bacterium]